jgi:hypothetical protein
MNRVYFERDSKFINGNNIREIRYTNTQVFIHTYSGKVFKTSLKEDYSEYTDDELLDIVK